MEQQITIFNIIKYVRDVLLKNKYLEQKFKGQIVTIEGKENITFPFATLTKTYAEDTSDNKDYVTYQEVVIQICVVSNSYKELCELSEKVYEVMESHFNKSRNKVRMSDNTEDFDSESGTYIEMLQYTFKL